MFFDVEAHRDCFKTDSNEAHFWHGTSNGTGGPDVAKEIATRNEGKTMEMCMVANREELEAAGVCFRDNDDGTISIDYGETREESRRFWDDCSRAYAEQASGNVHVVDGCDPRPNGQAEADFPSTYNRIERPALEKNQDVNSITHVDPCSKEVTGVEYLRRHGHSDESGVECLPHRAELPAPDTPQGNGAPPGADAQTDFDPLKTIGLSHDAADSGMDAMSNTAAKGASNASNAVDPTNFSL